MTTTEISPAIYTEAAEWLERLSHGQPLDKLSKRRFSNWLEADPAHIQVFESMVNTWKSPALNYAVADARQNITVSERIKYTLRIRWWQGATLAGFLFIGAVSWQMMPLPEEASIYQYATVKGEEKDILLEDGSRLNISAASDIFVKIARDRRLINLKRGAAYFDVASDKQRPFEVKIGTASVVAVGTEFNIDRGTDFTDVIVHEGAVEVTGSLDETPILLKAGEQVRIRGRSIGQVQQVDISNLVDWRAGWLELRDESLSYLIERLNRESDIEIQLSSAGLGQLRIAGRFRLKTPRQSLALLAEAHSLVIEEKDHRVIISQQQ